MYCFSIAHYMKVKVRNQRDREKKKDDNNNTDKINAKLAPYKVDKSLKTYMFWFYFKLSV